MRVSMPIHSASGPLALLSCLILTGLSADAAGEVTLPEEALFEQLTTGDPKAARDGFEALVFERLQALESVPPDHPDAAAAQVIRARALARTIRLWQVAEVQRKVSGRAPPQGLNHRMLVSADALMRAGRALAAARAALDDQSNVPRWLSRSADRAQSEIGRSMLESAVFLRGDELQQQRQTLLEEAGKLVDAPPTLEALDRANPNEAEMFRVQPSSPSGEGTHQPPHPQTPSQTQPESSDVDLRRECERRSNGPPPSEPRTSSLDAK